jgi:hypothetical protein
MPLITVLSQVQFLLSLPNPIKRYLRINKNHVYKIRRLIQNETLIYFYAEADKKLTNNKKGFYLSIIEQGFNFYDLLHSSAKNLLDETLFSNYGFILKDSFYAIKPNNTIFENIEKTFAEKLRLIGVKLNDKFYLTNVSIKSLSFCYRKEFIVFSCFLSRHLKPISSLYRNNVN